MRMSFFRRDEDPFADPKKKPAISPMRIATWVGVAAIAVWLIISGFIGIIVKGG